MRVPIVLKVRIGPVLMAMAAILVAAAAAAQQREVHGFKDTPLYWLDETEVLLVTLEPEGARQVVAGERFVHGVAKQLARWSPARGTVSVVEKDLLSGAMCFADGSVFYRTREGGKEVERRRALTPGVAQEPAVGSLAQCIDHEQGLQPRHGELEFPGGSEGPVVFRRADGRRMTLEGRRWWDLRTSQVNRGIRYYDFRGAYLLAEQGFGKASTAWWLYPDGRTESIPLAKGPWDDQGRVSSTYAATKAAVLVHCCFNTLYAAFADRAVELARGVSRYAVSPSGCKVAFLQYDMTTSNGRLQDVPNARTLDLCAMQMPPPSRQGTNKAFLQAAIAGDVRRAASLLDEGADIHYTESVANSDSALHHAARRDDVEMATLLLRRGANVDTRGTGGYVPLHVAAGLGKMQMAVWLVRNRADLSAQHQSTGTPLHAAVLQGHGPMADLLLKAGADVNARNALGDTPLGGLRLAARIHPSHEGIVRSLIAAGAELASERDTVAHAYGVLAQHFPDIALELARRKVALDYSKPAGYPLLFLLARYDRVDVLEELKRNGTALNLVSRDGRTALHAAAMSNRVRTIDYLLCQGVDASLTDRDGRTAHDIAISNRFPESARRLRSPAAC